MYSREDIDKQAEREGKALQKQGRYTQSKYRYIRQSIDDNTARKRFESLFKK